MAGAARRLIEEFWRIQDDGDYRRLVPLFAEDAVLEDPVFGTFRDRTAIADFMARMVEEMRTRGVHFTAEEIQGDERVAWARWTMHGPAGPRPGVGIYLVENGRLVYYRDYLDPPRRSAPGS